MTGIYSAKCIICGWQETEVKKMHCFPRSIERSRRWHESLGIVFTGDNRRNYRICNRHFDRNCYIEQTFYRLRKDAIPTRYQDISNEVNDSGGGVPKESLGVQQPDTPEPPEAVVEPPQEVEQQQPDNPEPAAAETDDPLYIGEGPVNDDFESFTLKCSESLKKILGEETLKNLCEIVVDPPKRKGECRTCLTPVDECTSKKMSENCLLQKSIKEVVFFLVPELESKLNDDHLVCNDCCNILESTMKFIMKCLETDAVLEKRMDGENKKDKEILVLFPETENEVKIEVEEDGLESIDGEHNYCIKIIPDDAESSKLDSVSDNFTMVQELLSEDNQNKISMEFDNLSYAAEMIEQSLLSYCEKNEEPEDAIKVTPSKPKKPTKPKEMKFSCKTCKEVLTNKEDYELHLDVHPPHVCEICGKGCKKKESLKAHKQTHNDPNSFICEVCGKGFKEHGTLRHHLKSHVDGRPHLCDQCSKTFRTKRLLNLHIKYVHNNYYGSQCTICGLLCRNRNNLNVHTRLVHFKEKPYECNICGRKFGRSDYLLNHKARHTGDRSHIDNKSKSGTRKLRKARLLFSLRDPGQPVPCKFCGQVYKDLVTLKRHLHVHLKRFPCQFCSLTFHQKVILQKHEEMHRGGTVNFFRCNVCWKKYKTKEALDEHVVCHNNPQHSCDLCGKTFNRKFLLSQHKVMDHTNISNMDATEDIIYDSLLEVSGMPT